MNGYNVDNNFSANNYNSSPSIPQINITDPNNSNSQNYTHNSNNNNNNSRLNFNSIKHLYPSQSKVSHSDNNSYENLSPPYRRPSMSVDSIPFDENDKSKTNESSIPLSLTAQELTLQESKTYMRWYSDILARTNNRTISVIDVFNFLTNFKISDDNRNQINQIFFKISSSVNIGEFFALLRVISHTLRGEVPSRKLIKIKAPVPTPPSILSKKRQNDEEEDSRDNDISSESSDNKPMAPLDIDSFTQFLLTGERPDSNSTSSNSKSSRKSKKVKFSDQVNIHNSSQDFVSPIHSPAPNENQLDYTLPMDQLLIQMQNRQTQQKPEEQAQEKEELKEMESQINHFHHLNAVDTISVDGTPIPAQQVSNDNNQQNNNEQLLKPNMTGPAQMSKFISSLSPEPSYNNNDADITPLRPNVTGPADMARLFAPNKIQEANPQQQQQSSSQQYQNQNQTEEAPKISLSAFSSQMTGQTMENTLQNGKPPVPRHRSYSSPTPNKNAPPPPPPRRRNVSNAQRSVSPLPISQQQTPSPSPLRYNQYSNQQQFQSQPPALPPKIPNNVYSSNSNNDSTTNILDDLKALQEEVDKIRSLTGGF
ncbi:uncharacterized protein KGF55_000016 [Candida pseudojiufengensis]|uniref:uncharacterized protein n=1 Tax=Candida pseudojiufengensis TaxID=497109 RepID=UPI00222433E7|nr:uncharacterized protein KGF55_000016 [Candida pseudojiufengensis]KAI5968169.1 hypothetical protein KGF55_000016 [Candida pseudojiufengensis]